VTDPKTAAASPGHDDHDHEPAPNINDQAGPVTGEPDGLLDAEPALFDDEPETAPQTCECGNTLSGTEARSRGTCRPCHDRQREGGAA
jgi:hypothetical protein